MHAARALRRARRLAGLSQAELARRAGVAVQAVHRVERGASTPRADTLDLLLAACGADLQVVRRRGTGSPEETMGRIDRILGAPPDRRISPEMVRVLGALCARRLPYVVLGSAAARLHGAPVPADRIDVVIAPGEDATRRYERAVAIPWVARLLRPVDVPYEPLRAPAEPLSWHPAPSMRVFNRYIDVCTGAVAALEDLIDLADPDEAELLAAVGHQIDRRGDGYRINRLPYL